MDGMDNLLMTYRDMTARDWLVDAAVAQPADMAAPQLPRAADGAGHGVAGMAERIHVLGGSFSAGDGENGGFCVRASIPLRGTEA